MNPITWLAARKKTKPRVYHAQQKWHKIGEKEIFFRSSWELKYAKYLQWQKEKNLIKDWFHEPKTFWFTNIKRGTRSYLPDFKILRLDGTHYWVEVKGYMDAKSATKLKRFSKYYPEEELLLVDRKWFVDQRKKNIGYQE